MVLAAENEKPTSTGDRLRADVADGRRRYELARQSGTPSEQAQALAELTAALDRLSEYAMRGTIPSGDG
jgi:hypothetical protein